MWERLPAAARAGGPGGREGPHGAQLRPGPSPTLCRVHRALPGRCNGDMQSNAVGSYPHPVLPPFHSSSKKRPPNHRARKNLLTITLIGEAWRLPLHADPLARTAVCWLCIRRSQGPRSLARAHWGACLPTAVEGAAISRSHPELQPPHRTQRQGPRIWGSWFLLVKLSFLLCLSLVITDQKRENAERPRKHMPGAEL